MDEKRSEECEKSVAFRFLSAELPTAAPTPLLPWVQPPACRLTAAGCCGQTSATFLPRTNIVGAVFIFNSVRTVKPPGSVALSNQAQARNDLESNVRRSFPDVHSKLTNPNGRVASLPCICRLVTGSEETIPKQAVLGRLLATLGSFFSVRLASLGSVFNFVSARFR